MNVTLMRQPLTAGIVACLAFTLTAAAQTTSSPYEPELNSIVLESTVDLANLKVPATLAPSLSTLSSLVLAGVVELRARLDNYDPVARTFRTTLFVTPPSSAKPIDTVPQPTDATLVSQAILRVDSIYHVKGTPLSMALVGRFVTNLGVQLKVDPGTPFMLSFTYPNDAVSTTGNSNAAFGELSFLIPGLINIYSSAPVGSITVTPPPSSN